MKSLFCAISFLFALVPALSHADEEKLNEHRKLASGEPERCLGINRIKEMKVIDKRSILFYVSGSEVYLNDLPHACNGLTRYDTVMYRTSQHVLCNVDIITILHDVGSGFMPGASCGLGLFYPISKEDADMLLRESKNRGADKQTQ